VDRDALFRAEGLGELAIDFSNMKDPRIFFCGRPLSGARLCARAEARGTRRHAARRPTAFEAKREGLHETAQSVMEGDVTIDD
jgi:hypothetical protein